MIVKIDKLSHDFRGITRINDKVTFVSNAIPGEIVDIKITGVKKNINEGKVVSYIEKSEDRTDFVCPYYDLCGGCDTGHVKYDRCLEYKKDVVKDIMNKYAKIEVNPDIIYDGNVYGYRNKISLKVKNGRLALVQESTNELVNIDRCLLVNDNINNVIELLNDLNLDGIKEVIIRGNDEIMVILKGKIEDIDALKDRVNSVVLNDDIIYGNEYINIKISKYNYAVYPESFFQVNTGMIEKLYDKVKEYSGYGNRLLDLYCGAGTIGIYLSNNFEYIHGIEINNDAVRGANLNKGINKIENALFECKRANEINEFDYDTIVVDPPRAGLDKITINKLLSSGVKKIVYVSCNPITLARDVKLLGEKYEIEDMTLFDMFPNTKHVESVVNFNLK